MLQPVMLPILQDGLAHQLLLQVQQVVMVQELLLILLQLTSTVGIPVFTLGATSTRCQGAGTVTYTATATNNTGITYSLDAASIAGGNTINASTGAVTYVAGMEWNHNYYCNCCRL